MKSKSEQKQLQSKRNNSLKVEKLVDPMRWNYFVLLSIILLISFISYLPVLHNGLLDWDDDRYIKNNPLLASINLKEIFSQFVMGNYHPLTILTLATEYDLFGLNETGYHAISLSLHLLNVILVFYVVFLLSEKTEVALVASLLFGIHPLHVESVAWASELKDLLYSFFFLAAYICYLKYLKEFAKKFYFYALLLFVLSLFSKAMAASLPILLILTDSFKERKVNYKALIDKVPFFLLAILFGVIAIVAQKSSDSFQDIAIFSFPQRIIFACYGFITYLFKLILPMHLSAIYPYPVKSGMEVSIQYVAYLPFIFILAAGVYYSMRFTKKVFFSIGFFAITIFLVLQLLPVGGAIMADRYSYIPSIGIFYLAGEGFILLWNKKQKWISIFLLSGFVLFCSVKTYARCTVWKNELTLWNDVISQYQTIPMAYNNRGSFFVNENNYEKALEDYNKAIELKPNYAQAYFNRGTLFMKLNKKQEALGDFSKAIELEPDFWKAFLNRGFLYLEENKNEEALIEFNTAIQLKPDFDEAFYNRGVVFSNLRQYEEAISDYSRAISLKTNFPEAYYNRGLAEYLSGKKDAACKDLKKAEQLGYQISPMTLKQICN